MAGSTGAVGRPLVPLLLAAGHDVVAASRSGPRPVDFLDPDAVRRLLDDVRPDAVVHLLTALPAAIDPRHLERDTAVTNRLRTDGLRHLVGPWRLVVQGLGWGYSADRELWPHLPAPWRTSHDALRELESTTTEAGGTVLRFGHLYGPGTTFAVDGATVAQVRARRLPVIGGGTATWSFTHTTDAAAAVVAALAAETTGAFDVVDDDPAPVADWLPSLAQILDAPPPRRLPAVVARPVAGAWGVAFFTALRGADNDRATRTLGWRPRLTSWRDGFEAELGRVPAS